MFNFEVYKSRNLCTLVINIKRLFELPTSLA